MNEQRVESAYAGQPVHHDEANFHDQWAQNTNVEDVPVYGAFEAPTALENQFILHRMGDLRDKRLLDIGAGLGESSVYFALKGASVTATDISPEMTRLAQELASVHGVSIETAVGPAEELDVPSESFDLVYIANTIHHVQDRACLFKHIARVLKPGGCFFAWDPLAYNPAIKIYRRIATEVRTEDEQPLTFADLITARRYFVGVRHREFWIASLALFGKYYLIDRVNPNTDRYWKRIYRETTAGLWWWWPLKAADTALTRLPLVRRLAWNMVMWGTKA